MPAAVAAAVAAFQTAAVAVATSATLAITGSGAAALAVSNFVAGMVTLGAAGGGFAATLGTAAGYSALSSALSPKPKVRASTSQLQTKVGSVMPRAIIMGRTAVAGTLLTPTPLQSGRGNALATNFYALSHAGPSGVVESVQWGDDTVTFDAQGQAIGKYANNMWLFQKNGDWNQTSISFAGTPGISADTPAAWDSTKRARGCLVVALVVRYAASVLANNMQTPLFVVDANAAVLVDPRTGSAATTQAQRRNPAVWAYSWRLGWFQNSRRVIGLGQPASEIHTAGYAYAANVADANGWVVSGEATTADDRYAVEAAILQACAAVPVERSGLQSVVVSALRSSVGTISSNDLRANPKWRYQVEQSSRPTAIQTRYRSETNRWQMVEGAEVTDASWLAEDAGREKRIAIEYAYAGGGSAHVGHLAALDAVNAREPIIFTLQCKQQARYAGFVGDAVTIQLPEIGLSSLKVTILSRSVHSDGTVDYEVLTETDSKYAFASGKTSVAPSFTLQPGFDIFSVPIPDAADWTAVAAQITSGATSLPIVRVTGSASNYNFASNVVFKIRLNSGGSPWLVSEDAPPAASQHEFRGLTNNTSYIVGISYRGVTGFEGPVRELAAVTTGTFVAGEAGAGIGGAPILNSQVAGFANQAIDTEFTYPLRTWTNNYTSGGTWTFSTNTTGGVRFLRRSSSNAPAGSQVNLGSDPNMAFPCEPGQRIEASVTVSWVNISGATLYVTWYDANRGYITDSAVEFTAVNGASIGWFAVAPANARYAGLTVAGSTITANIATHLEIGRPFGRVATAEQAVRSPYVPGPVERNANQGATVGADFKFPDGNIAPIGRVDNAYVPLGENQVINSDLNQDTSGFDFAGLGGSNLTGTGISASGGRNLVNTPNYFGARNVFWTTASVSSGNFTGGSFLESFRQLGISGPTVSNLRRYATQVTPGERIYFNAKVAVHGFTNATVVCNFYDRDGAYLSNASVTSNIGDGRSTGPNGAWGLPANFASLGDFALVPANAAFAALYVYGINLNGAQSSVYTFTCDYFIAKVSADQTVPPAYNPGPVDRASDRTADAVPILEGPASVSFDVDGAGALSPGSQVPRTLQFVRKRGSVDVSTSTTWSIVSPVNVTLGAITNGGVNITAIAPGNSAFTVRSVRDGVTIDQLVTVQKNTIAAGVTPPDLVKGQIVDNNTLGYASSTSWTTLLSVNLPNCPGGYFETGGFYAPASATGNVNVEVRLTVNGVQVGSIFTGKGLATGGVPESPDLSDVLGQFLPISAGNRTIALQFRAPSTTGSIGTANGQFVVNVIPTA